jgi:hypothetical protein
MSLSEHLISIEDRYGAHNYHPIPVVLDRVKVFMFGTWMERDILTFCLPTPPSIKGIVILVSSVH